MIGVRGPTATAALRLHTAPGPALTTHLVAPRTGTMSFGSLAGFCSGYALKGIGRAGAFTVGCLFMGLTGLQRAGYIEVNWNKVEEAEP